MSEGTPLEVVTHVSHPFLPDVRASATDIDELAKLYQVLSEQRKQLQAREYEVRQCLALLTESEAATRHLRGDQFDVKVTMPKRSFSQSAMRDIWNNDEYGAFVPDYLKIQSFAPKLVEINKLDRSTGTPIFKKFLNELMAAEMPGKGVPTVSVKEK